MIQIVVNGERREAVESQTVLALIESLGLDASRLAVEFDREILKRDRWADTPLHDGASLEIVQFVGGG